jgi:hypothetical protein
MTLTSQIEPPTPMDLDAGRDFLMRRDVFTDDLIEAWLLL